jgi:hypothetical protein
VRDCQSYIREELRKEKECHGAGARGKSAGYENAEDWPVDSVDSEE